MAARRRFHLRRGSLIGIAAGVALAATAAIYVTPLGERNGGDPACAASKQAAAALGPFARGEVAAFQPASSPQALTAIGFRDDSGRPIDIGALGGRTILLNLWATWCAPCREEMPALDRLEAGMTGKDFAVVAVNIDTRDDGRAKAFLREIGVAELDFYADPTTRVFTDLKARGLALGLPTTILVDGSGCHLGVMSGPAVWDSEEARALIGAALHPG